MNRYQSHKIVEAAKIISANPSLDAEGDACMDFELEGEAQIFSVSQEAGERIARMANEAGMALADGFLMNYLEAGNDWISWSPAEVFAGGYDLVQPSSGQSKIVGYRELDAGEVAAINDVKQLGQVIGSFVDIQRGDEQCDQRWVSVGVTHLQQGLMALVRAIAKPDFF